MFRVNFLAVFVVVVVAFIASSLWYSPLLFGREFLELSAMTANAGPNVLRVVCEFLRTFVLAYVLAHRVGMLQVSDWKRALQLGSPAVDRFSCCSTHRFDALAERALEAGCDPCWRLAYQVCPDYRYHGGLAEEDACSSGWLMGIMARG
jgi:hypothetical protein